MTESASKASEVGERVAMLLGGAGIGYLVAQESLVPDSAESSLPLLVITLALVLVQYFRRRRR